PGTGAWLGRRNRAAPPLDCGGGAPACAQLGASAARERVGRVRELRCGLGSPPTGFSAVGRGPTGARDGLERRRCYSLRRRAIPGGGRANGVWERILGVSHLGSQLQDKGAGSVAARRCRTAVAARGCAQREIV